MTEHWRPIIGYEGLYEVSDHGRVKSLERRSHLYGGRYRTYPEMIRTPVDIFGGYKAVKLTRDRRRIQRTVHTLVLTAFVGPRPDGLVACHNDSNPTNNRLENLRWDTQSSNILDCVSVGNHPLAARNHCKNGHEFTPENTTYRGRARRCRQCERIWDAGRRVLK